MDSNLTARDLFKKGDRVVVVGLHARDEEGIVVGFGHEPHRVTVLRDGHVVANCYHYKFVSPVRPQKPAKKATPSGLLTMSAYFRKIGRKGGRIGGKRSLETMTDAERSDRASRAARARWAKRKPL